MIQGRKVYFLEKGIDFGRYYLTGKGKIETHRKSLFIPYSQIKKIKIEPLSPYGKFVGRIDLISLRYFESMLEVYSQTHVYARPFSLLQSKQILDTVRGKKLKIIRQ